jgi:hypothetical protein
MRLLLIFCATAFLISADTLPDDGTWIIDRESQLFIYGSTNINNFTCSIHSLTKADTLEYEIKGNPGELIFQKNLMVIPVTNFDCGNTLITRDFLQTLKSHEYPNLNVRFLTLEQAPIGEDVKGKVVITLAGVSRHYTIDYSLTKGGNPKMQLSGKHTVSFTEFGLEAPQKLMGLIKVEEYLEVEFRMILRPLR